MTLRPRTIKLRKGDEVTLQYLGAALVLQWSELSEEVQQTILRQALVLADHNSYHLGQLVDLRRALGAWPAE